MPRAANKIVQQKRATDVTTIRRCSSTAPALDRIIDGGDDEGDDECAGDEYGRINPIVSYLIPSWYDLT